MKPDPRPALFPQYCRSRGLPSPVPEFVFAPPRKFRFDWAWIEQKVALEVEGAVWVQGRHTRGSGFLKDIDKYNRAVVLGWRVVRCTPQTLYDPATLAILRALLLPA